jgi:general secretion pathway protein K
MTRLKAQRAVRKKPTAVSKTQQGAALLAVLWLAAGLSAIALTIASTVRGETERSSTDADGLKAYYLAAGAIDRMLLYLEKPASFQLPDRTPMLKPFTRVLPFNFPTGVVVGEIIPETSKLDVNHASVRDLTNLMLALGVDPVRAEQTVAAIVDWRSGSAGGSFTGLDQYYLSLTPSFRARHASFQEIEELLLVRGVTPDLFYGSYTHDAGGRFVPHAGLRDCLSVYGSQGTLLDVNTVEPAVMMAVGIAPDVAAAIVGLRKATPIREMGQVAAFRAGPGMNHLGMEHIEMGFPLAVTLRATAQLRLPNGQLSDVRRSVSELVMFLDSESEIFTAGQPPYHILRWYQSAVPLQ